MKINESSRLLKTYRPMLGRVLQLVDDVGLTQMEAAKILTDEGFKTERGGPISQPIVNRVVQVARAMRAQGKLNMLAEGAQRAKSANELARGETLTERVARIEAQRERERQEALGGGAVSYLNYLETKITN